MVEGHVAKAVEVQVLSSALESIRMLLFLGAFFLFSLRYQFLDTR